MVTFLDQTPIFEWYMIWCGSTNGYQKEIGLCAQNNIAIVDPIVNIMKEGGLIWTFNEHKSLHFDHHICHTSSAQFFSVECTFERWHVMLHEKFATENDFT